MFDYTPLFGPIPGGPELLIILVVIVFLFGANKIPELARASGQAMGEFQRGREEIEQEIRDAAATRQREPAEELVDETDERATDDPDLAERATGRNAV
ncbi:twin-arginine translocase TatA/TatE family subunit [Halogranum rubrum]|uniref:Sec-independent protein translocase protein TatA n=1 Tax=Halogranum salarium B-1 TaxID=1210908 RepID=J3A4A9_9EURY|nr:twin-arginine translocase TatA/TatE family subunit [Halogranum salarium]EJN60278.1 hypothetical protein HSB1_08810 [Halogranum salarium B-1]